MLIFEIASNEIFKEIVVEVNIVFTDFAKEDG